ncbi:hypothetical protein JCM11251_000938 [Rhodosporidiobolus azoricus]
MDDDTYSDDDLWDSLPPELLTQLDSAAALPPSRATSLAPAPPPPPPRPSQLPLKRPLQPPPQTQSQRFGLHQPLYGTARPSGILRPAQPPQRKKPRVDPLPPPPPPPAAPAPAVLPAPVQRNVQPASPQRVGLGRYGSRNGKGEPEFVDPNPWAHSTRDVKPEPASQPPRATAPFVRHAGAGRGAMQGVQGGNERDEEEEEDLPAIQLDESALLALDSATAGEGGRGAVYRAEPHRGVTVARPPPPVPAPAPVAVRPPPPPLAPQPQTREGLGQQQLVGGMSEAEKRELELLRAEKAKLQQVLASTQSEKDRLEREVITKMGENKIVRAKLGKAEAAHAAALKLEKRDRQQLQDELEKKEKEYKASMERMKMEDAFRRQELATASASRHRSSSQRPPSTVQGQGLPGIGSANSQRFYHRASTSALAPTSPSLGRSRSERAASARPSVAPPAQPAFGQGGNGFAPAAPAPKGGEGFGPSQVVKRGVEREREGSMGPPKGGVGVGKKSAEKGKEKGKGKGRAVQLQEEESFFGGGMDDDVTFGEAEGDTTIRPTPAEGAEEEEEEEEGGGCGWDWVAPPRDERAELLAALFAHTSMQRVDTDPAVVLVPPPGMANHHHHQGGRGGGGRQSFPPSTSTLNPAFARHPSRSLSHASQPPAPPVASAQPPGPFPTLHALLNLRFPPSTPPLLVAHYESTSRSLFALFGRVVDPSSAASQHLHLHPHLHPFAGGELDLPTALASALTSLLATLDAARLPAALTTLLRLLSALVFSFEGFGRACTTAVGEVPVLPTPPLPPVGMGGRPGAGHMLSAVSTAANGSGSGSGSSGDGGKDQDKEGKKKQKMERVQLLPLLGRIIARYGRPDPPVVSAGVGGRLGTSPSTASAPASTGGRPTFLRSRKARLARPVIASSSASALAGQDKKDEPERVPLEREKREKLVEAVVAVVEGVGWRVAALGEAGEVYEGEEGGALGEGAKELVREGKDALVAFVRTPCAIATLIDSRQPIGTLLSSVRILTLFACRPALFRPLLGVKFYDAPDTKNSKLPLVDRIATLLAMPRSETSSAHQLDLALLSLSLRLLTKHEDALMLVVQSASFVPEVLAKMWRDVRTVWEWDGREVGGQAAEGLKRTTLRLSHLVHLLYYLAHAPHSSLTIGDLLTGGPANASLIHPYQLQAVNDIFTSALGTLAFATIGGAGTGGGEEEGAMPSWTAGKGFEKERERLVELGYLAQELLEDVSPIELEEIEVCFGPPDAEEGEDDDDMEEDEMEMQDAVGGNEVDMVMESRGREAMVGESQL